MRIFSLIFCLGMSLLAMGQVRKPHGESGRPGEIWPLKGACPLKDGVIEMDTSRRWYGEAPNPGLSIEGKDTVVYSVAAGQVQAVFSVGDVQAIMIRTPRGFYTYSALDSVLLKKGDSVRVGQILGFRPSDLPLDFVFSFEDGKRPWKQEEVVDCKIEFVKPR